MPVVAVLPVMSATTATVAYPTNPDTLILDSMPSPAAAEGVDTSGPSPHAEKNEDSTTTDGPKQGDDAPDQTKGGGEPVVEKSGDKTGRKEEGANVGNVSPSQSVNSYPQALPVHLTPQQPGYYVYNNSQVTPEPPSPAGPASTGGGAYDVGSFFQQSGGVQNSAFTSASGGQHPYAMNPNQQQQPPQSPSQMTSGSMGGGGGIPPASPLFPRSTGGQATAGLLDQHRFDGSRVQLSPGPPYLYPNMGGYGAAAGPGSSNSTTSPEEFGGWGDNRNAQAGQTSPQISAQGIPIPYVPGMPQPRTNRSYSFDSDGMLPPSVDSQQQQDPNQTYSYAGQSNPGAAGGGGAPATLFAHQSWGYPGSPQPDMYPNSPLQPRATMAYPGLPGGPPRGHPPHPHMAPYGNQFYPATSPGPPIQTTTSNKGPDGANLFIFHIPNHFTNLDMYQLFCPYGNLLSVRIMVEKDTGRSRGFGFVSYDSPDAAALAIKELNGFPIGNKRLKVQHKQIRPSDHDRNSGYDNMGGGGQGGGYQRNHMALPPSGPMAMNNNSWYYNTGSGGPQGTGGELNSTGHPQDLHQHQQQQDPNDNNNPGSPPSREEATEGEALSNLDPLRQNLPDVGSGGGGETI